VGRKILYLKKQITSHDRLHHGEARKHQLSWLSSDLLFDIQGFAETNQKARQYRFWNTWKNYRTASKLTSWSFLEEYIALLIRKDNLFYIWICLCFSFDVINCLEENFRAPGNFRPTPFLSFISVFQEGIYWIDFSNYECRNQSLLKFNDSDRYWIIWSHLERSSSFCESLLISPLLLPDKYPKFGTYFNIFLEPLHVLSWNIVEKKTFMQASQPTFKSLIWMHWEEVT